MGTIDDLQSDPWPDNLDVTPLVALRPWRRVRDGDYRLFVRPLSQAELEDAGVHRTDKGYLVARVVDKQYATRTMKSLRQR